MEDLLDSGIMNDEVTVANAEAKAMADSAAVEDTDGKELYDT